PRTHTLSLHDALPILLAESPAAPGGRDRAPPPKQHRATVAAAGRDRRFRAPPLHRGDGAPGEAVLPQRPRARDRRAVDGRRSRPHAELSANGHGRAGGAPAVDQLLLRERTYPLLHRTLDGE